MLEDFFRDLTHGARMLVKHRGFASVAIVSIAIGVGANAAMFSIADGLVFRPLPVPRASEIVAVSAIPPRAEGAFVPNQVSYPDYVDLRDQMQSVTGLAAHRVLLAGFARDHDEVAQSTLGLVVSGNFFDVLEIRPALGRFFRPDEDRVPDRDAVLVLSHETWTNRFGADPGVIDRQVRLGGRDFTVVGVAPASFTGMHLVLRPAFYVPMAIVPSLSGMPPDVLERRDQRGLAVTGRLKPGVSLEQARQEATLIASGLEQTYPDTNRNYGLLVRTAFDAQLEERGLAAPNAVMLMALAFVVLLLACANVAGLLMSRAPEREREIALRLAIGGGRLRVTRQLITESLLLAAGGGALGLAFAYAVIVFFSSLPIVSDIGVRLTFDLDRRAIVVGLALAATSALLASLVPAWRATQTADLVQTLRTGRAGVGRPQRLWGRNGLVSGQIALALILLTVTVSMARAFQAELQRPGFRTTQMLLATFEPGLAGYDGPQTRAFFRLLRERAQAMPGVMSAGMTTIVPLNQDYRESVRIVPEGRELPPGTTSLVVARALIDEGYLATMEIPVISGRNVNAADTAETARVALVSQAMAARYWPGEDPVGKRIRLLDYGGQPWVEIVGVTADAKYEWIGEPPTPRLYMPQAQDPVSRSTLLVASSGASTTLAARLRDVVREIDSNMPMAGVRTMEEFYRGNATGIVTTLVGITGGMGVLGLVLATVGLYGLVAYASARRTHEIGIRMAIGARPGSVMRMVLRHGLVLATAGVVLGVLGSMAAGRLVQAAFATAGDMDVTTYLTVVPMLVAVTLLAAFVPARRASRIDPLRALRQD